MTIFSESTYSTIPFPSELTRTLESEATCLSNPVPTIGASGLRRYSLPHHIRSHQSAVGIIMLQKGISDAEIDAIWLGATSV